MVKKPTYEELNKMNNGLEKLSFKHLKELLKKKSLDLQERVKELACLYAISNLFENPNLSIEEILERTVNLLPAAWKYPEITCARIDLKHQVFQTTNYKKTAWRQVADITIDDDPIGAVEVYYLKERSDIDEGPFLKDERKLINAVAEKVGKIIQLKSAEKSLIEAEYRYRILNEKVADGVTLLQDGRFQYANRAFASLFDFEDSTQVLGNMPDDLFQYKMNQEGDGFYGPFESAAPGDEFFRTACIQLQGQDIWVEGHHTIIQFKGKPAILSAIRDVTEKVLLDNATRQMATQLQEENIYLRSSMKERYRLGDIIGKSKSMQVVYDLILKASNSTASVSIYGESGTGKEMIAHAIHDLSNRRDKEFVTVHCGAIPELLLESEFFGHEKGAFTGAYIDKAGYLDIADGGSLFLDEVGELSLNMQVKLLRTIDGGEYTPVGSNRNKKSDFRIIAATNKNYRDQVDKGLMREDFYYRINVIPITSPPLREREEDILLLIDHFLELFSEDEKHSHLPGKIMDVLYNYHWPGNIRELKNVIQRYITVGQLDLPGASHTIQAEEGLKMHGMNLPDAVKSLEGALISKALSKTNWNRSKAANLLGISRKALFRKMKKIDPK